MRQWIPDLYKRPRDRNLCDDPINRERQEADAFAAPAGMLERSPLAAAGRAARTLPQDIAGRVGAPADYRNGTGERRMMQTAFAIEPYPRCRSL